MRGPVELVDQVPNFEVRGDLVYSINDVEGVAIKFAMPRRVFRQTHHKAAAIIAQMDLEDAKAAERVTLMRGRTK